MTDSDMLVLWMRAVPGRRLMSDSDGTIKAFDERDRMFCALDAGKLMDQIVAKAIPYEKQESKAH